MSQKSGKREGEGERVEKKEEKRTMLSCVFVR